MNKMIELGVVCGVVLSACAAGSAVAGEAKGDYPIKPVGIRDVAVKGGFWLPRFETNRLSTVKADFRKSEETGRINNFAAAGKRECFAFRGIPFDDSDVYKIIEGAAYTLATHPDPELEKYVDGVIAKIASAQEPDGYLYTARTLGHNFSKDRKGTYRYTMMGPVRWSHISHSHELYNVGHMYEAAVAYYEATGKRTLLDVAIRSADLIDRTFGPSATQLKDPPGHEEIELALCRLYRATGEKRYLELAQFFLDTRGRGKNVKDSKVFTQSGDLANGNAMGAPGAYNQNHLPVTEQREAVGHAVRAAYLYCGMADVAALTGNKDYVKAIDTLWENVVTKKLHVNGSIGARRKGEAFGANYELPNAEAYLETCAGIGLALWNQRMFMMHGDAKYVDVMELGLYNGILSGVSISGDEFFYPNPLASRGGYKRSKWFGCSCCPVNVVRFVPQIAQFAYATREDTAYVNLFIESDAKLALSCGDVSLAQRTAYPWSGDVRMEVTPPKDGAKFALNVRVPGWCVGRPVPSDLYTQTVPGSLSDFSATVNGKPVKVSPVKGYCVIDREWKKGDVVSIHMNMPVRRLKAHDKVEADRGRLAVACGPVVYCAEGVDNGGHVLNKAIAADAVFTPAKCDILGNVYPAFTVPATYMRRGLRSSATAAETTLKLVPYFAWCHRGAGELQTWFPVEPQIADVVLDVKLTASHSHAGDSIPAMYDGILPKSSDDLNIPRFTFWDHLGSAEWVQCEFGALETVGGVDVYWFDDGDKGRCRVPQSWKVLWRPAKDAPWQAIDAACPVAKDRFCTCAFPKSVKAQAIRLEVQLKNDFSGGILEWRFK